jgi:fructose-specific phosphotransferase system IIC component
MKKLMVAMALSLAPGFLLGAVALTIAFALAFLGPPVAGFLLTRAVVWIRRWRSQPQLVLHAVASTYAIYIGPGSPLLSSTRRSVATPGRSCSGRDHCVTGEHHEA